MKSLKELMDLKNKVAVITGGAGHIGFSAAETLAELGANIVLLDIDKAQCDKKAECISNKYNVETLPLIVDLTKEDRVRLVPENVLDKFGRLDILINCAALAGKSELKGWAVPFENQLSDSWRMAFEVNLTSIFVLIQACQKALASSEQGSIINISSIYGLVGPDMRLYEGTDLGNPAAYGVTKGGLIQFTRWLATVLAPQIRVNTITPGGVFRDHSEPFLSRYIERTPLKRMAKEEDLKGAIAYLASELSGYVTGQNIVVDGGWTAW